ncbi:MAG: hypothetical protein WCK93_11870 [Nitrosomonadales bacterium]
MPLVGIRSDSLSSPKGRTHKGDGSLILFAYLQAAPRVNLDNYMGNFGIQYQIIQSKASGFSYAAT